MSHVLDNPAWNAMISANSHLAIGNDEVRYFPENLSPFAGLKKGDGETLQQLFELLSPGRIASIVIAGTLTIPAAWKILYQAALLQMCGDNYQLGSGEVYEILPLQLVHVPQMIALTKLTSPGPFAERTIEFGHYSGIFHDEKLIAMAGQRLHSFNYAEISAVCTHPDHSGKGYGTAMVRKQAERILESGDTPFLHVRKDNLNAINIYDHLGFTVRREMNFYVIQKPA